MEIKFFENELKKRLTFDKFFYTDIFDFIYELFYFILFKSPYWKNLNLIENIIKEFIINELKYKERIFKSLTEFTNDFYHYEEKQFDNLLSNVENVIKQIYILKRVDSVFKFYKNNINDFFHKNDALKKIIIYCKFIIIKDEYN